MPDVANVRVRPVLRQRRRRQAAANGIHRAMMATAFSSTTFRASGGIWNRQATLMRWNKTDLLVSPGTMIFAPEMPSGLATGPLMRFCFSERRVEARVKKRARRRRGGGIARNWRRGRSGRASLKRRGGVGDGNQFGRITRNLTFVERRRRKGRTWFERAKLVVGDAVGVGEMAVELARLDAEHAAGRGRVAGEAILPSGIKPVLDARAGGGFDLNRLGDSGGDEVGVGIVRRAICSSRHKRSRWCRARAGAFRAGGGFSDSCRPRAIKKFSRKRFRREMSIRRVARNGFGNCPAARSSGI